MCHGNSALDAWKRAPHRKISVLYGGPYQFGGSMRIFAKGTSLPQQLSRSEQTRPYKSGPHSTCGRNAELSVDRRDDSATHGDRIEPRTKRHYRWGSLCAACLAPSAPHTWSTLQRREYCSRHISFASLVTAAYLECSPHGSLAHQGRVGTAQSSTLHSSPMCGNSALRLPD